MKKTLITLLVLFSFGFVEAQSNLTMYNMKPLPQRLQANPALDPDCKWYFGMPAISSFNFNLNSNSFSLKRFNNALVENPGSDSFTLDITKLSDMFDKESFINLGINQEWINFGFRVGDNFVSFNITEKVKTRVSVPGDFFAFVFEGNGGDNLGRTFDFDWGIDVLHTREFALGYQRSLMDEKLKVGGRLKYIYGLSSITTVKNDLSFTTAEDDFTWNVQSDLQLSMASSYLELDSNNIPDERNLFMGADNKGYGIDLGVSVELSDALTVYGSIIDLGQISWKENTKVIKSKNPGQSFEFKGIDVNDYLYDSLDFSQGFEELGDSLMDAFGLDTVQETFTTGLLGEFYLGGTLDITEKHNAGVLFYGSFYNRKFYPAFTLSWNSRFSRALSLSASYTIMRGNFSNVGLGLSFNAGPEQFYIVSDNVIGALSGNVKNISARFGWNHTFGRKKWEQRHDI
jgi:hypothetical protein